MNKKEIFRGSARYYEIIHKINFGKELLDFLGINLPPFCNYKCNLCLAGQGNEIKRDLGKNLNRKEYQKLITDAYLLGIKHIEISGEGEPLLYFDFLKYIISFASNLGIHTLIHTNGSLLTKEIINFLNEKDTSIMVSLSYIREDKFNRFTGTKNQLLTVLNNINLLTSIFSNKKVIEGNYYIYRIGINAEYLGDNQIDLRKIKKECINKDIFFNVASLIGKPDLKSSEIMDLDCNSIIISKSLKKIGHPICALFFFGLGIRCDGEVLFENHSYLTSKIIGNIRDFPLYKLLERNKKLQKEYFLNYSDNGFCPLRNPKFTEFCKKIKSDKYEL
jgi:MoaA/NifB/PqqE/SkfB family radical SAM enzyme